MISIANEIMKSGGTVGKYIGTKLYKYVPVTTTNIVHKKVVKQAKNEIKLDISNLVILGGTFEKVGGEDEAVGGGDQKVG